MIKKLQILLDQRQQKFMVLVLVGMLVAAALEMIGIGAIPAFVALLTDPDRILGALPDGMLTDLIREMDTATLTLIGACLLAALFLLKNLYLTGLIYAESRLLRNITVALSNRLFSAYLYSPYTFHLQRNPAHLIRNIGVETTQTVQLIRGGMLVLREGLVLLVVFLLLMLVDPLVSLSVFMLLGTSAFIFYIIVRRKLTMRGELAQDHRGRQVQAISQGIGAIKDAKILGREPYLMQLFGIETFGKEHHEFYQRVISALPRLFLEVVAVIAVLLVAAVFVLLGRSAQSMLPVLALLAVAVIRLVPAFNAITSSLTGIRYSHAAIDLVCSELETLEQQPAPAKEVVKDDGFRLKETISLHDVHYRYPGAATDALRGVSFTIHAGDAVAIIGPTGAGKSTLVDVILGLLSPTSGEVCVDGRDIKQFLTAWQSQIGYIPQDIYLLDESIHRNIAFGLPDDEIDDHALTRAVNAAQLDTFVQSLPAGKDTFVGDRGIRISGGQRQRIGIARALYHDPSVLVMDEATSSLDNETERAVIDAITRMRKDRTLILIAHRMTTVRFCDRLILLEDGRIKDTGTYPEIVDRHKLIEVFTENQNVELQSKI